MMPPKKAVVASVQVYRDESGEYRWVAKAANNRKVADSGEGYMNRSHAKKMAKDMYPDVRIEVVDASG
jgi:uncharacterized protein YegP (UPF0339 family)